MASRFILKSSLEGLQPLLVQGAPALQQYEKLYAALQERIGSDAAALFAQPIITAADGEGTGSISWYGEGSGEPQALQQLPPDRRAPFEDSLRRHLALLLPLRSDPELGPLLGSALILSGTDGIVVLGDRVVLVGWGLVPDGAPTDPDSLRTRFQQQLGRYAERPAPGPRPRQPARAAAVIPAAAALPASGPAPFASAWDRWLLPAALVVAALFLVFGVWLGTQIVAAQVASRPASVADAAGVQQATDRLREQNQALERQIEETRRGLEGNVCVLDPAQRARLGLDREAPVPPNALPPPAARQAPFQGSLPELLRQATVLVIAIGSGTEGSTGTGFFISADTIVTNRHVVQGAQRVIVVNAKLQQPTEARIAEMSPTSEIFSPDFAVLRLDRPSAIQPLALTRSVKQLDPVIAAGYPDAVLRSDDRYRRLLAGDASVLPSVIMTDGRINAVQEAPTRLLILPHSAIVSAGNSGGPLVDGCGRVVGVNTFVMNNQSVHINYAQKTDTLIDFLKPKNIAFSDKAEACPPETERPPGAPAVAADSPGDRPKPQPEGQATPPAGTPPAGAPPARAAPSPPAGNR